MAAKDGGDAAAAKTVISRKHVSVPVNKKKITCSYKAIWRWYAENKIEKGINRTTALIRKKPHVKETKEACCGERIRQTG